MLYNTTWELLRERLRGDFMFGLSNLSNLLENPSRVEKVVNIENHIYLQYNSR